jgi:hypothetical protein
VLDPERSTPMNRSQIGITFLSMVFGLAIVFVLNGDTSFGGEIMDSFCAEMGSHEMLTSGIESARDCTRDCVKFGAKYVLYSPDRNKAYGLDDQGTPAFFAGEQVRVTGTYDDKNNTIHVKTIQPTLITSLKEFTSGIGAHFGRRQ